jgi:nitroreductase
MEEAIKKILTEAVYAPSGDNIQPWRFEIRGNELLVYNTPEKDVTLYNYKQHGSLIAHGALLENINIIAPACGCSVAVDILPEKDPNLTAKIAFSKTEKQQAELYAYIAKRCTNRKPYKNTALRADERQALLNTALPEKNISIKLIEDPNKIKPLAYAISQGDRLIFENKTIHDFLFSHIRWDEHEEQKYKNGLYLKTMELNKGQQTAFRLFKNWKIMSLFNKLGMPKMAVKGNEKIYSRGSALGAITMTSAAPADYIYAGRVFQRLWLTATSFGLSLQPLTALPFLMQKVFDGETAEFSKSDTDIIKTGYAAAENICGLSNEILTLLFRVGYADAPSGLSSRLEPEIKIQV